MKTILLATQSKLKYNAVRILFPSDKYEITCIDCNECNLPPQPVNCSRKCAEFRLNYCKEKMGAKTFDYYIAIENGIEFPDENIIENPDLNVIIRDFCAVVIQHKGVTVSPGKDRSFRVPVEYYNRLEGFITQSNGIQGYSITIGDLMHEDDPNIDSKNWVKTWHGVCRGSQIESKLRLAKNMIDKLT
jgi:non-canonical (house-cleaning) NTP pyrophosphatase